MASNDFLQLGTTTALTLLYDTPKEGSTRFGPYRAYRVRTPDGDEHTFFPPRSLYPELDRMTLHRGSQITVRATERISDDGRVFPRYDVRPVEGEAALTMPPVLPAPPRSTGGILPSVALKAATSVSSSAATLRPSGERASMLACVALKAAASTSSAVGDAEIVVSNAERYFAWLARYSQ